MQIYKTKTQMKNDQIDYLLDIIKTSKNIINKNKIMNYLNIIHDILTINLLNNNTDKKAFDEKISEINKLIVKNSLKTKIEIDNKIKHFNDSAGCDFVIESLNI